MSIRAGTRHEYVATTVWTGNRGAGTASYGAYGRQHRISVSGKADIAGSSDPSFRGDADRYNPEELFVASVSACHMLFFLSLCARAGVNVTAYEDEARGTLELESEGGGRFTAITLRPVVTVGSEAARAAVPGLHHRAHELCFIARSCRAPIHVQPTTRLEAQRAGAPFAPSAPSAAG